MDNSISIRTYLPQDADATIDIFLRAICEVASKDYSPDQIKAWAQVNDPIAWATHRLSRSAWVAEKGGNVIGFADLTMGGYLDMMFVHPNFQGCGIASRLLERIEQEATRLGFGRIYTEASLTARPFFKRRGFVVIRRQMVEKRGQILENCLMEKYY